MFFMLLFRWKTSSAGEIESKRMLLSYYTEDTCVITFHDSCTHMQCEEDFA